ncbi:dihydroxyacetone kinase subunit DhaK [Sinorhizobium meliloti]|uniref:bifunctional sugar-binding transcriptional regulator/dihydroxyacetone kinase subunit DhaK n=1 Tax=Rhizobium meliloti TaxID=382 RepID=UPI001295C606|nr:bifunctional sugar-binding transcriptional regulator/dihydroxyacetone kinase subunit DhaK [Sinorhizobium meliloti]MDW9484376.1 dihydroxyacetone kinase subunit DhaK [Sinorhizobium meliloti]MDW9603746.1 dihydroxyacetone kinase subunit DhaK [Sinorhizobium meliloti]MDW9671235.1 dihydroxyacetone kinase subunit DhaK [Sinorhizobium meliloti]MDW9950496.1 dihydroxyacetone kinase subunit DhaK [Sinorhizobium meliloti]MDX0385294.1 dihydroxyacetone kinase subunit DhaK [Sinorhizobium meliloti]
MTIKTPSARKGAANRSGTIDASDAIPLRYGDDPYVWACWLYYEDGMTQGEIAEAMGVSRATVNSYLADAREKGIVNISIEPARLASLTIAQELKRHFGLTDCLVVPSDDNARPLIDRLGAAGAQALPKLLKSGDTLAVAWGRTVLSVGEHAGIASLQDMTVVQATGGTTASFAYTPELCASAVARAISARCVNITAPAVVKSPELLHMLLEEPLVQEQFATLARANRVLFGISSLRPNSTIHTSGFFESVSLQDYLAAGAVGVVAGRFIDERGRPVAGPLDHRTVGISLDLLRKIGTRIAVAGGFDKVPALLAALRGGYVNVLITDAATGHGILRADGVTALDAKLSHRPKLVPTPSSYRTHVKKFLNNPNEVVEEMLNGAVKAHEIYLQPINGSHRALVARNGPRPGKVGLVIGGGTGHEPCFLGYVGKGLADAVAVGNIFSSPPPDPIVQCAEAASGGEGVLFVYGNYAGDVMNFEMAAEIAEEKGIKVKTVLTTDDVASSPVEDREGRRGVAGNFFIFKIAGAACDRGLSLEACEAVTRKANLRTYTVGVALEPGSMPQTRRHNFEIGPDDMEVGMGIHGEPGVTRERIRSADEITDSIMDRIFKEMKTAPGERVAVLVNSFGATPLMELYILFRRVQQRLAAKDILIEANWIGHYCTSLDMAGASITILHLDQELSDLLHHPCETAFLKVN